MRAPFGRIRIGRGFSMPGTEWGMYVSFDDGANWQPLQLNLPIVSIRDLHVRDHALVAATHGRSFWMIDDLRPLHQLRDEVAERDFYLFQPKPSYRMAATRSFFGPNFALEGRNHPDGVLLHYFVDTLTDDTDVKLEILEMDGDLIREFDRDALEPREGGNRFVWDMRYEGFETFPGMVLYSSPNIGPRAVAGAYRARLTVDGENVEQELEIVMDPRLTHSAADYQNQFDFLIRVRDRVSDAHRAIKTIRDVRDDIERLTERYGDDDALSAVVEAAEALATDLTTVENIIHETRNESFQDPLNYGIQVNNRLAFLLADQQARATSRRTIKRRKCLRSFPRSSKWSSTRWRRYWARVSTSSTP